MLSDYKLQRLPLFVSVSFFVLAWLLPNHAYPWSTAYQEFASFFACLLLMFVVLFTSKLKFSPALVSVFFLPLIPLLQQFAGVIYFAGDAWVAALYLGGFAMMLLVGYNLSLQSARRYFVVRLLAGAHVVGAVLSLWIALRQWLHISTSLWEADLALGARPYANLAQANHLATLLCLGVVGVLYFYEKRRLGGISSGLLAVFLLFGVALTQSRTPWVAAVAVAGFWWWKSASCKLRLTLSVLLGWVGIYVLFVLVLPVIADVLLLTSSHPLARAQSMERLGLWGQFFHAIWQGPLWGYGWNQVSIAQVSVALAYPVSIVSQHSHNILLDLLLWNGPLLGGGIILGVAVWLLRLGWCARSTESLFVLLAVGVVLIHGMLEFPLEYAFFLFPLGLWLGVISAELRPEIEIEFSRWLLSAVFLLGVGLFFWTWKEYRVIEEDYQLMRFENARVGYLKAEQPAPDVIVLSQLREFIRFARTPATEHMSTDQLEWMRKISQRNPYPWSLFRYALALGLNSQPVAAREQLLVLRSLHGEKAYVEGSQVLQKQYPQLTILLEENP
ncbi:PglL family O-oligosaccharyltransferase [Pseudomonas taeanensis]|jgi:O-antigen ligase|uniref:PglL family O-oligosaccharyltransferase n=1 Tax=Pseudomonas taeanensis TaxID=574962 RepID=UPI00046ABD2D|nr:O-antigen ligase family protein [Pseudomonas taeanensis]